MIHQTKIFSWFIIICGLGGMENVGALNILGIVSSASKSHSVFANAIFNEYANSGHSVIVVSPYKVSLKINHFKLDGFERIKKSFRSNYNMEMDRHSAILQQYEEGLATTRFVINHDSFKRLMSASIHVDAIIFDYDYNDALLAIVQRFQCPVFILALNQKSLSLKRLIDPGYPLKKFLFQRPIADIGLWNGLHNIASQMYEKFIVDFYYQKQQKMLYQNAARDLALTSEHLPSSSYVKFFTSFFPNTPIIATNVQNIVALHIPEKSVFEYFVPDPLDRFIHSTEEGCIYVSLGADTDPATLPKDKVYKIFQVFNSRPEKIIWAWNGNTTMFNDLNKFFIRDWLPQDDILRHRNIKAFVTNGGALSLQEAVYHEIPVIGIPLTHQQSEDMDFVVQRGLGVKLQLSNLTLESFVWALNEIIDNDSYKQRLALEADLMKDQLVGPMKTLKYWINYFYQHRHDNLVISHQFSVIDYYLSDFHLLVFLTLVLIVLIVVIIYKKVYKTKFEVNEEKYKYC